MDENTDDLVQTTVRILRSLRKVIRIAAANESVSMDSWIQTAVLQRLAQGEKKSSPADQPRRKTLTAEVPPVLPSEDLQKFTSSSSGQNEQLVSTISVLERIETKLDTVIDHVTDIAKNQARADLLKNAIEKLGRAKKGARGNPGVHRKRGKGASGGEQKTGS